MPEPTVPNNNTAPAPGASAAAPTVRDAGRRGGPQRGGPGGQQRGGPGGQRGGPGGQRGGPGGQQRGGPRREGPKRDAGKEKMLDLRRVARVVAGGKRFRFRATVVVGDERGQVGIGIGKGVDVAQAVAKAKAKAGRTMVTIRLMNNRTLPHEVEAKYSAAYVRIKPAPHGHGLRAGSAVRSVIALAGVKDATAKVLGRTPNKLTNAWATLEALKKMSSGKHHKPEHRTSEKDAE